MIRTRLATLLVLLSTAHASAQTDSRATTDATRFFKQHDANGDGKLSRDEFPANVRRLFDRIDTNQDGFADLKEDIAYRANRKTNRGRDDRDRPTLPKGFVANRDIEYGQVGDTSLRLDVYAPGKRVEARPLIVWVHGGGWRNGSKDRCPALRFLEKGCIVASIDYRLSGVAIYPAQIHDCKAAIRWLRANAKTYSIDPQRIGVWGSSAGGHLAALLGTSGDVKSLEGDHGNLDQSSRVQAVCDFFGPTDFLQMDAHALPTAPFKHDASGSPEALVIGGPIQENKQKVAAANPITYVTPDDAPFLIVHGDKDPLVPLHQSQLLFNSLKAAGVEVSFHKVKGGEHGFGRNAEVDKLVDAFFDARLQKQTPE